MYSSDWDEMRLCCCPCMWAVQCSGWLHTAALKWSSDKSWSIKLFVASWEIYSDELQPVWSLNSNLGSFSRRSAPATGALLSDWSSFTADPKWCYEDEPPAGSARAGHTHTHIGCEWEMVGYTLLNTLSEMFHIQNEWFSICEIQQSRRLKKVLISLISGWCTGLDALRRSWRRFCNTSLGFSRWDRWVLVSLLHQMLCIKTFWVSDCCTTRTHQSKGWLCFVCPCMKCTMCTSCSVHHVCVFTLVWGWSFGLWLFTSVWFILVPALPVVKL